tara:strand:- start:976 stop:1215 length:240 start_codon:yes stop_codon:yes gene_type:complete
MTDKKTLILSGLSFYFGKILKTLLNKPKQIGLKNDTGLTLYNPTILRFTSDFNDNDNDRNTEDNYIVEFKIKVKFNKVK